MNHEELNSNDLAPTMQGELLMNRFSRFKNPSFQWRIILIAFMLAMPGALSGAMLSLYLGEFLICSMVGGLVGAIGGALIEAWPGSSSSDSSEKL